VEHFRCRPKNIRLGYRKRVEHLRCRPTNYICHSIFIIIKNKFKEKVVKITKRIVFLYSTANLKEKVVEITKRIYFFYIQLLS